MRKCHFCEQEIQNASVVCEHCGRNLIPGRTIAPSAVVAATAPAVKKKMSLWMKGVVGFLILIFPIRWLWITNPMFGGIGVPELIVLAVIVSVIMMVFRGRGGSVMSMYCPNCGSVGAPKKRVKGSFAIEIILWLCFLVPGMIYSIWRLTTKETVCPTCGAPNMIPVESPKARAALTPPIVQEENRS